MCKENFHSTTSAWIFDTSARRLFFLLDVSIYFLSSPLKISYIHFVVVYFRVTHIEALGLLRVMEVRLWRVVYKKITMSSLPRRVLSCDGSKLMLSVDFKALKLIIFFLSSFLTFYRLSLCTQQILLIHSCSWHFKTSKTAAAWNFNNEHTFTTLSNIYFSFCLGIESHSCSPSSTCKYLFHQRQVIVLLLFSVTRNEWKWR